MNDREYSQFVGVDISKAKLDIAVGKVVLKCKNAREAIVRSLVKNLTAPESTLVVMEATGGYEAELIAVLQEHRIAVAVANPLRIRKFAEAMGKDAKTDPIDAQVIAEYGRVAKPQLLQPESEAAAKLKQLVRRRRQLVTLAGTEKNHLEQAKDSDFRASIKAMLEAMKRELQRIEKLIKDCLKQMTEHKRRIEIISSVKGVGTVSTAVIMSELPELGALNRQQIAKLAGVAPLNNDTGQRIGKRKTKGGRWYLRKVLYMSALVATRHNPQIKSFYQRLLAAGKPKKLALIACMRKLLIILNTLLKTDQLWQPNHQNREEARRGVQRGANERPLVCVNA